MKSIEEYINMSKKMHNISEGGSPAYKFGDVVLIKYSTKNEFGKARQDEEKTAKVANKKNAMGVKTPKHLAIKRVIQGEDNFCYVLQEKAKGRIFYDYTTNKNDAGMQLKMQEILLNAPTEHFEKGIKDLGEIFNMGVELKPKNIFYDEAKNGGFTFIDLIGYDEKPIDKNNLVDLFTLESYFNFVYSKTAIQSYNSEATEQQKYKSNELKNKIFHKTFKAMENVFTKFKENRRWFLRRYTNECLEFLEKNGTRVGDLRLTEDETMEFNNKVKTIVSDCIQNVANGDRKLIDIKRNDIRNSLIKNGLDASWCYHPENKLSLKDFENEYEYKNACSKDLEKRTEKLFNHNYDLAILNSSNKNLIMEK